MLALGDGLSDLFQQLLVLFERRRDPRVDEFNLGFDRLSEFDHKLLVLVNVAEGGFGVRVRRGQGGFALERGEEGREGRGEAGLRGEHGCRAPPDRTVSSGIGSRKYIRGPALLRGHLERRESSDRTYWRRHRGRRSCP